MLKELKSLTDWYKMNLTKPHLGYMTSSRGRPRMGEHSGCGECTTRRAGAGRGTKDCEIVIDGYAWWFVKNISINILEITSNITSKNKVMSSRSVSPEMYHKQLKFMLKVMWKGRSKGQTCTSWNVLNWSHLSAQWNDHDTETAGAVLQAVHGSTVNWDYPSTFVACPIRGRQRWHLVSPFSFYLHYFTLVTKALCHRLWPSM